jgi:hypothetical protein
MAAGESDALKIADAAKVDELQLRRYVSAGELEWQRGGAHQQAS